MTTDKRKDVFQYDLWHDFKFLEEKERKIKFDKIKAVTCKEASDFIDLMEADGLILDTLEYEDHDNSRYYYSCLF